MKRLLLILAGLFLAGSAQAIMDVPSQGWDGALNITANTTIDLSQAMTGTWSTQPSGYVAGRGIYDPAKWAIVFHYTSVTVASGATLTFTNHPANPPVVWLVEGTVQINGTVNIAGKASTSTGEAAGGPGGFRGGRGGNNGAIPTGGGFEPGGGVAGTSGTIYGAPGAYASSGMPYGSAPVASTYGNAAIIPLVGGSGAGGRYNVTESGGGGGGAILVGAQTSVVINGTIDARGGNGSTAGGSGGAVRIITPSISGTGSVTAIGISTYSTPGVGRIRIEANTQNLGSLGLQPVASVVDPGDTPQFWPDASTPTVRVVSLNGVAVPSQPQGSLVYPNQDVSLNGAGDVTAVLEATNVPTTATIQVFIVKQGGARTQLPTASVTLIGGNTALSTWQVTFPAVTNGMYAIQARAVFP